MNLERLEEALEHTERLGIADSWLSASGKVSSEPIIDAARLWLRWGPAVEAAEEADWCKMHRQIAWGDFVGEDPPFTFRGYRCRDAAWIEGANAWDCVIEPVLVVRRRLLAEEK